MEAWNFNSTWVEMQALALLSLRLPAHVITILEAENRQKVENFWTGVFC